MKSDAKKLLGEAIQDLVLIHHLMDGVVARLRTLQEGLLKNTMDDQDLRDYKELKEIIRTLEMVA